MTEPQQALIQAEGLSRNWGPFAAVRDVSFSVGAGEVVAFLGPNGAGKSTTMRMLTGFIAPSGGVARIAGFDMATHREEAARQLGYLPENGPLYEDMTPRASLRFFGDVHGLAGSAFTQRFDAVVDACALAQVLDKPIHKLSKGYRQRVGLAQALLHDPRVLILDEPTSGLDPNQIRDVRRTLRDLGRDKTILVSTHILQEVEAVAERVVFLHEGMVAYDGPVKGMARGGESLEDAFRRLTRDAPRPVKPKAAEAAPAEGREEDGEPGGRSGAGPEDAA